jgi:hypothetical protein
MLRSSSNASAEIEGMEPNMEVMQAMALEFAQIAERPWLRCHRSAPDCCFVLVAVGARGQLAGGAPARSFGIAPVRIGLGRRPPVHAPPASTGAATAYPGTKGGPIRCCPIRC